MVNEKIGEKIEKMIFILLVFYFSTLFFSKMETLRTIALFSAFVCWLINIKNANLKTLINPISFFFYAMIFIIVVSYFYSFNPQETLSQIKGEPIKALLGFTIFASAIKDVKKINFIVYSAIFYLTVIVISGFYTFFFVNNCRVMTSNTFILYAGSNRFPYFVLFYLPFIIYGLLNIQNNFFKTFCIFLISLSTIAYIMSSYRIGLGAFLLFVLFWFFGIKKVHYINLKKYLIPISIGLLVIIIASYLFVPVFQSKVRSFSQNLPTITYRTTIWEKIFLAFEKKPLLGWGWGDSFVINEELFKSIGTTPPDWKGHHSMFFRMLFHTGIIGLIFYVLTVFYSSYKFLYEALVKKRNAYIFLALSSVVIFNFIFIGLFDAYKSLHWLAVIVAMGVNLLENQK